MIRLRVPSALLYRDLAVRAVQAACKLVGESGQGVPPHRDFDDHVVSAFSEAFNNAAIHSYRDRTPGEIEVEIEPAPDCITLRLLDRGHTYDIADIPDPDLDALPESGMGLYIIKSFMDEVRYDPGDVAAGRPNVLTMSKRLAEDQADTEPKGIK